MKSPQVLVPRRVVRLTVTAVITALLAAALSVLGVPVATESGPCTAPIVSKVACESTQTGIGHPWTTTGILPASVTVSGWQQAPISSPAPISANTTYVVSYCAPNASYPSNSGYFTSAADKAPLHVLASGTDGPNGVYRYGTSTGFPTDSYNNTKYWVDAVVSQ